MEIIPAKLREAAKARLIDGEQISPALIDVRSSDRWYPPREQLVGVDYLHRGLILAQAQYEPEETNFVDPISMRAKIGLAAATVAYAIIILTEAYLIRGR